MLNIIDYLSTSMLHLQQISSGARWYVRKHVLLSRPYKYNLQVMMHVIVSWILVVDQQLYIFLQYPSTPYIFRLFIWTIKTNPRSCARPLRLKLLLQSRGGRKPTNCPSGSGNSCLIRSTTQDGRATLTSRPKKPQHQLTKLWWAINLNRL